MLLTLPLILLRTLNLNLNVQPNLKQNLKTKQQLKLGALRLMMPTTPKIQWRWPLLLQGRQ